MSHLKSFIVYALSAVATAAILSSVFCIFLLADIQKEKEKAFLLETNRKKLDIQYPALAERRKIVPEYIERMKIIDDVNRENSYLFTLLTTLTSTSGEYTSQHVLISERSFIISGSSSNHTEIKRLENKLLNIDMGTFLESNEINGSINFKIASFHPTES